MNVKESSGGPQLVVLYFIAFFLSLENVLDYFYDIDTVFKPYRVLMIVFVILSFFSSGIQAFRLSKHNLLLASLFIVSVLIAVIRNFFFSVSLENVISIATLILINFIFYLSVCNLQLSLRNIFTLIAFFLFGLLSNYLIFSPENIENGRFAGFFQNPNSLGFSALIALVFIFFLFRIVKNYLVRILLIMSTVTCVILINESGSRSAFYLAIAIAAFAFIGSLFRHITRSLIVTIFLIMGVILFAGDAFLSGDWVSDIKIHAIERQNYKAKIKEENERVILAKACYDAFVETNFIGLGLGQFNYIENFYPLVLKHNSSLARSRYRKNEGLSAHGTVWSVMAEIGIVGLVLFVLFLYQMIIRLLNRQQKSDFFFVNLELFVALFVYSLVHVIFLSQVFWFFLGLINVLSNQESNKYNVRYLRNNK